MSHISNKIPIYHSIHQPSQTFGNVSQSTTKVNIKPIRQQTQFTCVSASISMALNSLGFQTTEADIDQLVQAQPMDGADWVKIISCLQHFGCRSNLVVPSTVNQIKNWTDQGKPVLISWNPESKPWSHASVVFDVQTDQSGITKVFVADPNIPDPNQTVRVVPSEIFYRKWVEKDALPNIRRPALFIEREIDRNGHPTMSGW